MTPNQLLVQYLVNSCLYYEFGVNIIPDAEFDRQAQMLRVCWKEVDHPHKKLVDYKALKDSVTGFYLEYPSIVRSVAAKEAARIPGSLVYGWTEAKLTEYVIKKMKQK